MLADLCVLPLLDSAPISRCEIRQNRTLRGLELSGVVRHRRGGHLVLGTRSGPGAANLVVGDASRQTLGADSGAPNGRLDAVLGKNPSVHFVVTGDRKVNHKQSSSMA